MSASELTPTPGESPLSADILGDFKAFQQKLENILNVKTVANTSGNFNKFATAAAYDRLMMFLAVPQIDPSVPQPVVQSWRRPLLGSSPG